MGNNVGDQISGRWHGTKIKNDNIKKNKKIEYIFTKNDLNYFISLTKKIFIRYYKNSPHFKRIREKRFNLRPTRAEILTWQNTFKQKKIKHIISIPYYYLKRIFFLNSFFIKEINFPNSIGPNR